MKIEIVGSRGFPYVYSGYETFVTEVAPRLVARGHDVTVHCFGELFEEKPAIVRGVRLVYVEGSKSKSATQLSHSLASVRHLFRTRSRAPDFVLFVNAANGLFGPVLRRGPWRTAINVDGLEWMRPKWSGLGARVYRLAAWMATKTFDLIITDADAMADVYRREFGCDSTVIEYGANEWHSLTPESLLQFGLERESYYLIVGRLIPDNNVKLMVDGFVRSSSKRKLVVVGDVPYRDAYAESVKSIRDERVIFAGYVKDQALLRELYCGSYAYLHGHEHGGTNPALLKALGAGCCVLALDTPFAREVLSGERHGRYFAKSSEALGAAVEELDAAPSVVQAMRSTAREPIHARYNWDRIALEYERAFVGLQRA